MEYNETRVRKRGLSERQKKIRLLTALSLVIYALFAVMFFWLVNRPGFIPH
jgi:hypothetical protein